MLEQRITEMMAEERIRQSREEAERARLVRANLPRSIPAHVRLAVSVATLIIEAGTLIKQRYEPLTYPDTDPDCPTC